MDLIPICKSVEIPSVIIDDDHHCSKYAIRNIEKSPIYNEAEFPNGKGQYIDMMQRAAW
jgi:hypothetical protein